MIRRAIFGKVHGRGVKEIWLINQFPAKHKGVASGPKIVFARPGLARLLGYGYGVINNEFIIYIAYSPHVTAFRFSETHQLLYDPLRSDFMSVVLVVRSVYKQSREKHRHLSLYVQNIPGYREKKKELLKILNKMSFQISLCHRSKIIVNQTEWKFTQRGGGGRGVGSSKQFQLARKLKVTKK